MKSFTDDSNEDLVFGGHLDRHANSRLELYQTPRDKRIRQWSLVRMPNEEGMGPSQIYRHAACR